MKKRFQRVRIAMAASGIAAAFVAAGLSDGEVLLGTDAGATPIILIAAAVLLMLPALIHIYNRGEI